MFKTLGNGVLVIASYIMASDSVAITSRIGERKICQLALTKNILNL